MHRVTREDYEEAQEATRDILMMYVDMAEGSSGISHAVDVAIRFDPLKFVDVHVANDVVWIDAELLHAGSAMAILCAFYDVWAEEQSLSDHPRTKRYQDALEAGRLREFPDIERVIRDAVARNEMPLEDPWFDDAVQPLYRKFVLAYFRRLSEMDRPTK